MTEEQRQIAQHVIDDIAEYRFTIMCYIGSFLVPLLFKLDAWSISTSLVLYLTSFIIDPLHDYLTKRSLRNA